MFPQLWEQSGGQPGQVLLRSRLQMCTGLSACCVLSGGEKDPSSKDAEPVTGTPPCDLIPPQRLCLLIISLGVGLRREWGGGNTHQELRRERPRAHPRSGSGSPAGRPSFHSGGCGGGGEPSVPTQPTFSGARAGAGAAARRGRSLGRGQRSGMQQGTAPPRSDDQVPGARGGGCVGGHSPRRHPAPCRLSWPAPGGLRCVGDRNRAL